MPLWEGIVFVKYLENQAVLKQVTPTKFRKLCANVSCRGRDCLMLPSAHNMRYNVFTVLFLL